MKLERSPARLAVEALLGAAAGALLSTVLPGGAERPVLFALAGGLTAPLALLLTPTVGPPVRLGIRYGAALSILLALLVSFVAGQTLAVERLLGFATLIFLVGGVGHGILVAAVGPPGGGKNLPEGEDDSSGVDIGKSGS